MSRRLISILIALVFSTVATPAFASAGWYPTATGQIITVEYCLPKANMGTLILQGEGGHGSPKTFAFIKDPKLTKDSYCQDDLKYGFKQGPYHLKYAWKVKLAGEWGLKIYSPETKQVFMDGRMGPRLSKVNDF